MPILSFGEQGCVRYAVRRVLYACTRGSLRSRELRIDVIGFAAVHTYRTALAVTKDHYGGAAVCNAPEEFDYEAWAPEGWAWDEHTKAGIQEFLEAAFGNHMNQAQVDTTLRALDHASSRTTQAMHGHGQHAAERTGEAPQYELGRNSEAQIELANR